MPQIIDVDIELDGFDAVTMTAVADCDGRPSLEIHADWYDIRQVDKRTPYNSFEVWYKYNHEDKDYLKDLFVSFPISMVNIIYC